ncbi:Zn-ribbon domain-containing OB-fold protein [Streptomyces sp. NPDC056500]|uniref:Zn-ribbon domain-containing OB-fold protein n=1 Tax=Streptomyces sp. NPDC056500 TaxID=3345840 RepID=UPI003694600E
MARYLSPLQARDASVCPSGDAGLTYQRCRWCGTASFRRLLCPVCSSSEFRFERGPGHGVVVESTVVHRYSGSARNESLVRFPAGFVFRCRIVGAAPCDVRAGMRVRPAAGLDLAAGEVVLEVCDTGGLIDWR